MPTQVQPGPITARDYHRLLGSGCERKRRMDRGVAMREAENRRGRGDPVAAYPCVFAHGAHWHIGHALRLEDMELQARWIRFGHLPYPADRVA